MMRRCLSQLLLACVLAASTPLLRPAHADTRQFAAHWTGELIRLQGWPAAVQAGNDILTFATERVSSCELRYSAGPVGCAPPPVLYLLDRGASGSFAPGSTHAWAILDMRSLLSAQGSPRQAPNTEQLPFHNALLVAVRAVDVLLGAQRGRQHRVGLVGEGYGAAAALAVAGLRPDDVAFVCAHEPINPNAAQPRREGRTAATSTTWGEQVRKAEQFVDLSGFAPLIAAPTLISIGEYDQTAAPDEAQATYEAMRCQADLVTMRRARHCQPQDLREWQEVWREWTRTTLGYE